MNSALIMNQCRICYEITQQSDMFSPCRCRGTSKFVHRECLNKWISTCDNVEATTKCMECNYTYKKKESNKPICYSIATVITAIFPVMYIFILLYNSLTGYIIYKIDDSIDLFEDDDYATNPTNTLYSNGTIYLYYGCAWNLTLFCIFMFINTFYFFKKYKNYTYIDYQYDKHYKLYCYIIIFIISYALHYPTICIAMLIATLHYFIINYCEYIKYTSTRIISKILKYNSDDDNEDNDNEDNDNENNDNENNDNEVINNNTEDNTEDNNVYNIEDNTDDNIIRLSYSGLSQQTLDSSSEV